MAQTSQGPQTASAASASAQSKNSATGTGVSEVVVTATRRGAVNVMQVPLAVDAYAGKTLQQLDITSEGGLAKLDPSLNIQTYGAVEQRIIIRGISSVVGSTTGVYLDETPLQGGFNADIPGDNTPTLGLHDIDHVEVLKGPQGTLFGAGSMDGTLRIATNQPNLETYSGWVDAEGAGVAHGDGLYEGSGGINFPIVKDQLALRINAWGVDGGGYINQIISGHTLDHVNDTELYGLRGELLWEPINNFSLLATANYQNTEVGGVQFSTPYIAGLEYPYSPYMGPNAPWTNLQPSQSSYYQRFQLYSLTAKYDLGFGQIIANTSYGDKDESYGFDTSAQGCTYGGCVDAGNAPPALFTAKPNYWYQTDDVRFASAFSGPVQIVAGVFYQHDHTNFEGTVLNVDAATGLAPCQDWTQCTAEGLIKPGNNFGPHPTSAVGFANRELLTTDEVAFYTQGDWKILPTLTATFGFRYFHANVDDELITLQNAEPTETPSGYDCGALFGCVTTPYVSTRQNSRENAPTYNASLLWQATPAVSFYVRAASGFRLGGVNDEAAIASQTGTSIPYFYGPDSLWDYEGGVKSVLFDHTLHLDLTIFHIDWSNEQQNGIAHGTYDYILNVGSTHITGLEFDTAWRPLPELTLSGGFTYVDATLGSNLPLSVADAGTPGAAGDPMPFVPKWQATGQAEYDHPLTDRLTGYLQGDFAYHGSSYSTFEPSTAAENAAGNDDYYTRIPAYLLIDLKAGVRWDQRYDVSVFVRNVANTFAWVGANPNDGGLFVNSAPPRTIGVRVSAQF
jgi:outer membrane receptor protein involved in Fe transport